MTQQQIAHALLSMMQQAHVPGDALDQAIEIREFVRHLADGRLIVVRPGSEQPEGGPVIDP